ncbi:TetR/AcrR family transcriptional regulator [Kordiimonas lacus]|uniref:Transcriptional regulator, TetR family n=1 Tax=Kordiimonas lacus TaxID=637679 RepID=A0A1G6YIG4_9PROT|nr:TetR/AcrR family transcriptional regulator [Kordiimonas lacus]SDD89346.1 transcriptional regulator, TetR family [Kordiimonas lacus]
MHQKQSKRDLILELAEQSVLQKGFAATSIDELIAAAGITKSGFFYHFKDKADLAKHLFLRYVEQDDRIFADLFNEADACCTDPLDSLLLMLKLLADMLSDMPSLHPGCMVASYCYQHQLFNSEIRDLNAEGVLRWRKLFLDRLEQIARKHPPTGDVDMEAVADMVMASVEGGIILSRSLDTKDLLPRQVLLCRDYIKRVFRPNG